MSKSTDLVTLIQGFRLYCLAEGRRPSTIRWYMGKLHIFSKWLGNNHGPLDAELLRIQHLRSFMAYLREVKADANNPYSVGQRWIDRSGKVSFRGQWNGRGWSKYERGEGAELGEGVQQ